MADEVILIAGSQEEIQRLLDAFTDWAERNQLQWKPAKFAVVTSDPDSITHPLKPGGQELETRTEVRYLGIIVKPSRFTKKVNKKVETKCITACYAISDQPFVGSSLPINMLCTLYRTNVRSVFFFGMALTKNMFELESIDRKLLQPYLKAIMFAK